MAGDRPGLEARRSRVAGRLGAIARPARLFVPALHPGRARTGGACGCLGSSDASHPACGETLRIGSVRIPGVNRLRRKWTARPGNVGRTTLQEGLRSWNWRFSGCFARPCFSSWRIALPRSTRPCGPLPANGGGATASSGARLSAGSGGRMAPERRAPSASGRYPSPQLSPSSDQAAQPRKAIQAVIVTVTALMSNRPSTLFPTFSLSCRRSEAGDCRLGSSITSHRDYQAAGAPPAPRWP